MPIANILYKIVHSIFTYRAGDSSTICTCQYIQFKSLTLKIKVKDVEDLDENWQTYLFNMHMCAQIGASRSSRLIAIHNHTFDEEHTNGWMDERTNELMPAPYTIQLHRNSVKTIDSLSS